MAARYEVLEDPRTPEEISEQIRGMTWRKHGNHLDALEARTELRRFMLDRIRREAVAIGTSPGYRENGVPLGDEMVAMVATGRLNDWQQALSDHAGMFWMSPKMTRLIAESSEGIPEIHCISMLRNIPPDGLVMFGEAIEYTEQAVTVAGRQMTKGVNGLPVTRPIPFCGLMYSISGDILNCTPLLAVAQAKDAYLLGEDSVWGFIGYELCPSSSSWMDGTAPRKPNQFFPEGWKSNSAYWHRFIVALDAWVEKVADVQDRPVGKRDKVSANANRAVRKKAANVRVVKLRRGPRPEPGQANPGGSNRRYSHRWWVRTHWRTYRVGEGRSMERPVLIAPYDAGPEGLPLADPPARIFKLDRE